MVRDLLSARLVLLIVVLSVLGMVLGTEPWGPF